MAKTVFAGPDRPTRLDLTDADVVDRLDRLFHAGHAFVAIIGQFIKEDDAVGFTAMNALRHVDLYTGTGNVDLTFADAVYYTIADVALKRHRAGRAQGAE